MKNIIAIFVIGALLVSCEQTQVDSEVNTTEMDTTYVEQVDSVMVDTTTTDTTNIK
jgi:hypothetical protein